MFKMTFSKVTKKFYPTILSWFQEPHVQEFFYGQGLQNTLKNLSLYCEGINNNGQYSFDHWIAFFDNTPFAFLMTSPLMPNDAFYIEGKKTLTLDLLIGPSEFLGRGLASKMIQTFILDQFSEADYFMIDPAKSNTKAIHVYEKAGFKFVDEFIPSYDPIPHMMMQLSVSDLTFQKKVMGVWGNKGSEWLQQLPNLIELLKKYWGLSEIKLVANMSYNYVALAIKDSNLPVVLKISCDSQLIDDEYSALQYFSGHGAISVFDIHKTYHALLLEQAIPGYLLKDHHQKNIDETIKIYADVVKALTSQDLPKNNKFKHVSTWCEAIDRIDDQHIESRLIEKAKYLKSFLLNSAEHETLCHGDLHLENIIQHGNKWLAIDPQGIMGEIAFEAAAFDLISDEEFQDQATLQSKISKRITLLASALNLSNERLRSWIFLRVIISAQWFIEDNGNPSKMLLLANHLYALL